MSIELSPLSQSIVKTLLYYDLFHYPLKSDEVYLNLQTNHVSETAVAQELQKLAVSNVLFQSGEFFSVRKEPALVSRRIAGNHLAKEYKRIGEKRARWIYRFPFVRAVMISGSLSKDYADAETDIDFFVVTASGHLWIARTLIVLFKRIFLLNSHKYFCVNYFIDENHLEIQEKNLFTATELSTLLPVRGFAVYRRLMENNPWVTDILPNAHGRTLTGIRGGDGHHFLKRAAEWVLKSSLGTWLEKVLLRISKSRWQKKYALKLSPADFDVAFKSTEFVSKNHPNNYQRGVMDRYRRNLEQFALQHTWKWVYD